LIVNSTGQNLCDKELAVFPRALGMNADGLGIQLRDSRAVEKKSRIRAGRAFVSRLSDRGRAGWRPCQPEDVLDRELEKRGHHFVRYAGSRPLQGLLARLGRMALGVVLLARGNL
jgi:hypothetical protein